jgi:hypothetical protein
MDQVVLLILFNHNYEKNIDRLKTIYENRFTNIYFIMPFYQGSQSNVIAVYENSFHFQGYITQALNNLKGKEFEHYIVIGDDLILNPEINESNYMTFFALDKSSGFIPGFFKLNDKRESRPFRPFAPFWAHLKSAIDFKINLPGIEVDSCLPSYEEARMLLEKQGINFTQKVPRSMFVPTPLFKRTVSFKDNLKRLRLLCDNARNLISPPTIPYPLVGSYSDIVIIPGTKKEKFMFYSGVFAALHLFVEIAIPSALAYSVPKIVTETDIEFKGLTYWGIDDFNVLERTYQNSLDSLFANFPKQCLYIHPVKLSRWK